MTDQPSPLVAVAMGSDSDLKVMGDAVAALTELGVPHEVRVLSAHRTPMAMLEFGREARSLGFKVIIAGAGGAAHLPPSCRREYCEWVAEAKRPETRAKRVAEAVAWMREGKRRNWKYESC